MLSYSYSEKAEAGLIDVLLNASAVRDDNGKILHSRSTWIDISEKKAAERKLQYIQRLNRLNIEIISDLLCLKDIDGVYLTKSSFGHCCGRVADTSGTPQSALQCGQVHRSRVLHASGQSGIGRRQKNAADHDG